MHDDSVSGGVSASESAHEPPKAPDRHTFEFHGNAPDYFRIWIVNLALSIVTLGIYSAWATVRTRRYFYANIQVVGSPFEYTAKPLPILLGRLVAFLLFAGYIFIGRIRPQYQLIAAVVVWLVIPWLIVRGLAFRARYTSWRGLNFRFQSDLPGAYLWYLFAYVLVVPTLGLMYPYIKAKQQCWLVEHHRYGTAAFSFKPKFGPYYGMFFGLILVLIGWMLVMGIAFGLLGIAAGLGHTAGAPKVPRLLLVLAMAAFYLPAYLGIYTYSRVRLLNLLYNHTDLQGHRLHSSLAYWPMYGIYLSNTLAILLTAGLALPWAKIRMARYRASCLALEPAGDLDSFVGEAGTDAEVGAAGLEMDGLLGIDIGM